ncbi:MAG: HDOD domain-containing protein [Burkholderiales bacterium]|nr:HDOD domain-containing protein [Burkholderiales bacterium]
MAHPLTLDEWLARLRPGDTPVFRHTKDSLRMLRGRLDTLDLREVTSVVLSDPLATLRLIYLANNRTRRHVGHEVATVEHAVMMQGLGVYLEQAARFPVLEELPVGRDAHTLASLYRLLRLAQHAAWQARDFAVLHADVRAEEVEVAAVLYYAPEFLFWLDAPDTARKLQRLRRVLEPQEAERQALGFALEPLRLMLLEAWKIPDVIRDMLDERHATRSRNIILRACLDIAHRSRFGWWDAHLLEDYQALADIEHTPLEVIVQTAHRNAVRVARHGAWIPAPPAAAWLPMLPGEWPQTQVEMQPPPPDRAAAHSPAPAAPTPETTARPSSTPSPGPEVIVCPTPDYAALEAAVQRIEQHLDGSLDLNQTMALVLKGLHQGLGLKRVVFAMVTPDGQRVKSRFTLGVQAQEPLRHLEFALGGRDLFARLMQKVQGLWLNADNEARLAPLMDARLAAAVGQGEFFAMSLFVGERPFGLIYADRGRTGCGLDAASYEHFKRLCLLAMRALSALGVRQDAAAGS